MPCANSSPARPQPSAACASRASGMPAPALRCVASGCVTAAILSPICTTMRSSAPSVMSRFVPLPMMSGCAPPSRTMRHTAAVSSADAGRTSARAGPPMRNEQCARIGSCSNISSPGHCVRSARTMRSKFAIVFVLSFPGQNPMPRSMPRSCSAASFCAAL